MVDGEVSNTTHGDRDTFLELRGYIRGAAGAAAYLSCFGASYARGCARESDYSFGDGTGALAVVIIVTFTSLHLPPLGSKPIRW